MNLDQAVFAFAGAMILLSVVLVLVFSKLWLLLTAFVGLNMIQASITGFCPLTFVFKKIGITPGSVFK